MSIRVAVTHLEMPGAGGETFLLVWPWTAQPTAGLARAIRNVMAGVPIVLVGWTPDGIRHFYGRPEHRAVAAMLDFEAVRWQFIEIEGPSSGSRHAFAA